MKGLAVAIIGADGAGKTTAARKVEGVLGVPARYIYMGVNPGASNVMLPTTRIVSALNRARGAPAAGGPPDRRPQAPTRSMWRRTWLGVRSMLGLCNRLAEEWSRQMVAWYHLLRGRIVLFDRHFYADYYAHDVAPDWRRRTLWQWLHGFVLEHAYPKPDLVILLDARPEVLWARKQEGSLEAVTQRREEYLAMGQLFEHFAVVDASAPQEAVWKEIAELILDRWESRNVRN